MCSKFVIISFQDQTSLGSSSLHNPMMGSQQPSQQSSLSHSSNPSTSTAQLSSGLQQPPPNLQQDSTTLQSGLQQSSLQQAGLQSSLQQPQDSSSAYSQSLG